MERQDAMHGPTRQNDVWGTRKSAKIPARKPALQKIGPTAQRLVVAVGFAGVDGTGEAAIERNKIHGGENHSHDPPGQTDAERLIGSAGVVNRERERGSCARGENVRVEAKSDTRQHAEQVAAGVQESETSFRWRGHSAQVVEDSSEAGDNNGGKDESPRMRAEIEENLGLNAQADRRDEQRHHENSPEAELGDAASAVGDFGFALVGDPERSVHSEGQVCGDTDEDRVPIENASVGAEAKVSPQRLEKITLRVEGNSAHHVAERGAKEDGPQRAREAGCQVPEGRPDRSRDKTAKFDRDAAQDEQPENHHQGQIESAEARGVENGESEEERAAGGDEPDFVAVPDRRDRADYGATFGVGMRNAHMNDADSEIEAVEQHVNGEHEGNKAKPEGGHARAPQSDAGTGTACGSGASTGP